MAKVKIYTKVGCPHCVAAKDDFRKRGVVYEEIDVHTVPGAAEEAAKLAGGRKMVPVIVENGKVTLGFCGES
jgi:glutaredoxin 3